MITLTKKLNYLSTTLLICSLAACSSNDDAADPDNIASINWTSCEDDVLLDEGIPKETAATIFECANFEVPMDHSQPNGEQIELAMIRHPATGTEAERQGSLFMNFGGVSGRAVEDVQIGIAFNVLPESVLSAYDIVGWIVQMLLI